MTVRPPVSPGDAVLPADWPDRLGLPAAGVRRLAPGSPWLVGDDTAAPAAVLVQEPAIAGAVADISPGVAGALAALTEAAAAAGKPTILILTGPALVAGEEEAGLAGLRLMRQALAGARAIVTTLAPVRGLPAVLAADALWWVGLSSPADARLFGRDWADWATADGPATPPPAGGGSLNPDATAATPGEALDRAAAVARLLTPAAPPAERDIDGADAAGPVAPDAPAWHAIADLLDPAPRVPLGRVGALRVTAAALTGRPLVLLSTDAAAVGGALDAAACRLAARALALAKAAGLPVLWDHTGPGFLPTVEDGTLLAAVAALAPAAAGGRTVLVDRTVRPTGIAVALPTAMLCRLPPVRPAARELRADLAAMLFAAADN